MSDTGLKVEKEEDKYSLNTLNAVPKTFEAHILLPKSITARAGVVIGNYDGTSKEQINIEVYANGKPRLYYKAGNKAYTYSFTTDIRSDSITHLAITVDGLTVKLYLNGVLKENCNSYC